MFCPSCGADRRTVAPIAPCPACGVRLDVAPGAPAHLRSERQATELPTDDEDLSTHHHRRRPVAVAAAAGVVAALGGIVATVMCSAGSSGGRDKPKAAGVAASAAPAAPPPPAMPKRIVLRVERVRIEPTTTEWDGPVHEKSSDDEVCAVIATLAGTVNPLLGAGVGLGCAEMPAERQRQVDPREPDLQLELRVGTVVYRSHVAPDQHSYHFSYSFVIPDEVIPPDGVVLAVLDRDEGEAARQEIGSARVTRDELIGFAHSPGVRAVPAQGLDLLEIGVTAHDGRLRKETVSLDVSEGGTTLEGIAVNAGDVVRIQANGAWQIGTRGNEVLGPEGLVDGRLRENNLGLFEKYSHGAAVALVGRQGAHLALAATPCVRFISPYAGLVWVGINDSKRGDNAGTADFTVFTRGSKPDEWRSPGALLACD